MKQLMKLTLSSVCMLSFVAVVGAAGQQAIRAAITDAKDRAAAPSFRLANASGKKDGRV